jgi:hypothetical protein
MQSGSVFLDRKGEILSGGVQCRVLRCSGLLELLCAGGQGLVVAFCHLRDLGAEESCLVGIPIGEDIQLLRALACQSLCLLCERIHHLVEFDPECSKSFGHLPLEGA